MTLTGKLDVRFSEAKQAAGWQQVATHWPGAELYWLTTVRKDGRPHITPLVGAWVDDAFVFCTGPEEQKAQNLTHSTAVAVTTGVNTWNDGLDVVVEGDAERVTGLDTLTRLADAIREKYHGVLGFHSSPTTASVTPTIAGDSHIAYVYRCRLRRCWRSRSHRTARRRSASRAAANPGSTSSAPRTIVLLCSWRGVFLRGTRRHHGRPHGRPGGAGPGRGRGGRDLRTVASCRPEVDRGFCCLAVGLGHHRRGAARRSSCSTWR